MASPRGAPKGKSCGAPSKGLHPVESPPSPVKPMGESVASAPIAEALAEALEGLDVSPVSPNSVTSPACSSARQLSGSPYSSEHSMAHSPASPCASSSSMTSRSVPQKLHPQPPPAVRMGVAGHSLLYETICAVSERLKLRPQAPSSLNISTFQDDSDPNKAVREDKIKHGKRILWLRTEGLKLKAHEMKDDGNCLFAALSHQLYGTPGHHEAVRTAAVKQLESHPELYGFYFDTQEAYEKYISQMSAVGFWGDEITMKALCDGFAIIMYVLLSTQGNWYLRYVPGCCVTEKDISYFYTKRQIFLAYLSPVHYNSLTYDDDTPIMITPSEANVLPELNSTL
jgi:hypothetical protein